ncbi:GHKL domain-containing protein, partial [bacterium AH-315-C07]|nr:GHKL domain-containing protein [bacterium AH-315-C07]
IYRLKTKNDHIKWVWEKGRGIYQDNEKLVALEGFITDITEQKLGEDELKKTNEELDTFVYKASHDLRAPLRSLIGLIDLIKMDATEDQRQQYLGLMMQSITKLDKSIQDLLDITQTNRREVSRKIVNLKNIGQNSIQSLSNLNNFDQIEFKFEDNIKYHVYSDKLLLETIFNNIISNAIKYHRAGAVPFQLDSSSNPYVLIKLKNTKTENVIEIEDNGLGIDADTKGKVFDMFYRGSDKSFGTGLGLYIVRNAVNKLGGTITIETALGKGSTFRIEFPNIQD